MLAANTHLHYHPHHEHIKLIQTALCLRHINAIQRQLSNTRRNAQLTLIFAGDLNSTPESAPLRLLARNTIDANDDVWRRCIDVDDNFKGIALRIDDMPTLTNATGTPAYTNYSEYMSMCDDGGEKRRGFAGCLDYIFVGNDVRVDRTIPLPSEATITKYVALPSKLSPSDHLPIICDTSIVHW